MEEEKRYTLRMHDYYDRGWCDISGAINVPLEVAEKKFEEETNANHKKSVSFQIFRSNTRMLHEANE